MRNLSILVLAALTSLQIAKGEVKKEANAIATAELLRGPIASQQRKVITDTNTTRTIWSDGVILEITDSLPSEIQGLIDNTSYHTDLRTTIRRVQEELHAEYHPARLREKSRWEGHLEFETAAPQVNAFVNPVYVAYVQARYPGCVALLKSKHDPVVFTVEGQIKVLLMPFKHPNDRTR